MLEGVGGQGQQHTYCRKVNTLRLTLQSDGPSWLGSMVCTAVSRVPLRLCSGVKYEGSLVIINCCLILRGKHCKSFLGMVSLRRNN